MECYENGIITGLETGGIELHFGNAAAMVKMTEMIAKREGFGDILAEGSARAARIIGKGSENFLITIKNKEIPAHMPQVKRSLALICAVNPFGPDHQSSEHDESYEPELGYLERLSELGLKAPRPPQTLDEEKVRFAYKTQCFYSLMDSLNVCQFVYGPSWQRYSPGQLVELVRAVTGWEVTLDELMTVGERRVNMMRAFNAREGIGQDDDVIPKKLMTPLRGGPTDGLAISQDQFQKAKEAYYAMAGWDVPRAAASRQKLKELGLDWISD